MASIDPFSIGSKDLSLPEFYQLWQAKVQLRLHPQARERVEAGRRYLEQRLAREGAPIYGINTGFGSLHNVSIDGQDLERLQVNLVRSHACGTGPEVAHSIVKMMLWLKAQSLSYGHSGVRSEVIERLIFFYNENLIPRVYEQGSLGASGDLAPLAHLSLPLLGEGELWYQNRWQAADKVLAAYDLEPLSLQSKEGLALLNGTQFMLAYALHCYFQLNELSYQADVIGALSLEAFDGRPEPFDAKLHRVRPHPGQILTAQRFREFLAGSELIQRPKAHVQDPYSLRCIPQVHGAGKDLLAKFGESLAIELNAVTDNPTIFPEEDEILSGGNFHGQILALSLDSLALAAAEWASISERRIYLLISGQRGLPPFLVAKPGLNSGLMIAQYSAAALVSQNKQLCTPASVDSIVSSNGQEDHVSMGANAATKLLRVVENLRQVLATELISASQALAFREESSSPFLEDFLAQFRHAVSFIAEDRLLQRDLEKARLFLEDLEVEPDLLWETNE